MDGYTVNTDSLAIRVGEIGRASCRERVCHNV